MTDLIVAITRELFASKAGGTNDPMLEDMFAGVCKADAITAIRAIEDAGYRIVPAEATEEMVQKLAHNLTGLFGDGCCMHGGWGNPNTRQDYCETEGCRHEARISHDLLLSAAPSLIGGDKK